MVALKKRMGNHKEAFGTLTGTDAQLEKYEHELVREGYRVEYFITRGVRTLHYTKEGLYDAITERSNGPKSGRTPSITQGVPSAFV